MLSVLQNTLPQDNVPYDYTQKNRHCLHFYKILLRISTEKQHFCTFGRFFLNKLRFHAVKLLHTENFGEDFKRSGAVFALNRNARFCSGNKLCLSAQSNEQVGNLRGFELVYKEHERCAVLSDFVNTH